jgi:hypothetical protein
MLCNVPSCYVMLCNVTLYGMLNKRPSLMCVLWIPWANEHDSGPHYDVKTVSIGCKISYITLCYVMLWFYPVPQTPGLRSASHTWHRVRRIVAWNGPDMRDRGVSDPLCMCMCTKKCLRWKTKKRFCRFCNKSACTCRIAKVACACSIA